MNNVDILNELLDNVRDVIEKQIDKEFTEYKILCLENLEYILEGKRNAVVKQILDGLDVNMLADGANSLEPIIQIKIINKKGNSE